MNQKLYSNFKILCLKMFESLLFQVSSEMELNLRETVAESVTNFCDENAFSCDRSDSKM